MQVANGGLVLGVPLGAILEGGLAAVQEKTAPVAHLVGVDAVAGRHRAQRIRLTHRITGYASLKIRRVPAPLSGLSSHLRSSQYDGKSTLSSCDKKRGHFSQLLALCGFEALPWQTTAVTRVKRDRRTGRLVRDRVAHPQRLSVPTEWAFSRFMANVAALERRDGLVSALVSKLRRELLTALPDYGECLGADGKAVRSHSTGRTLKGKRRASDPDADRGVHAHRGVDRRTGKPWERVASWFGCKLHLVADTKHGIPVAFSVERASVSEQKALFAEEPVLAKRCRFLSADRGYDQESLKAWLWDAHRIRPLIDIRMLWREGWDALPKQPDEPMMRPLDPSRVDNVLHSEQGRVFPRCPAAAYDLKYEGRAQCCANAGADPNKIRPTRRVLLNQANHRIFLPTAHGTRAWRTGYARRNAMERINARLDDGSHFENHTIRGKTRMTARVGLTLAVMMALALGSIRAGAPQRMRSLVGAPPKAA